MYHIIQKPTFRDVTTLHIRGARAAEWKCHMMDRETPRDEIKTPHVQNKTPHEETGRTAAVAERPTDTAREDARPPVLARIFL